jgi:ketosteroid isomerase-like protein
MARTKGARRPARWWPMLLVLALSGRGEAMAQESAILADSLAVTAVVERFHAALAAGDSAAVAALLAPGALILESGGIETREQYLGGHLRGDIAFAQAVPRQRGPTAVRIAGEVAWVSSTSVAQGTYREREINSTTAELMVLVRREGRWQIAAVHWSSRARR